MILNSTPGLRTFRFFLISALLITSNSLIAQSSKIKSSKIPVSKSTALTNIYNNQLKKIEAVIAALHPDLQYDYSREMDLLLT